MLKLVMVGIDPFEASTLPLLASVGYREPTCPVVVVDNGAVTAYPEGSYTLVRRPNRTGFAAGINAGAKAAGDWDWLVVLANDCLCKRKFIRHFESRDPRVLYGGDLVETHGRTWIDGYFFLISRQLWEAIGPFDEGFRNCAFEDADYSFRALAAGFGMEVITNRPFSHLLKHTRYTSEYDQTRRDNLALLNRKHGWDWQDWGPDDA